MRERWLALPFVSGLLACSALPYGEPGMPAPPQNLPEAYAEPGSEPGPTRRDRNELASEPPSRHRTVLRTRERRWWMAFDDEALEDLESRALSGNFSQRAAWARIEQARATARQAAAPRYPQVTPQGAFNWRKTPGTFGSQTIDSLTASLPVSYEVDWFGKYKGQHEAAKYDVLAARAEVESAAMTLSANVAETWYDLVAARERQRLLEGQLEINETFLDLTVMRFQSGLTSALDAHQQRQQVAATRAQLDLVISQQRVLENQLAVLVGAMPGRQKVAPARDALPRVSDIPGVGVPGDLLMNRPDVRASMQRIRAADERAAAAVASYLPSLVLSGSVGYLRQHQQFGGSFGGGGGGFSLPSVVKGPNYAAGATLTVPLFDGFQHKAQIDQQRAVLQEAMATYGQTVQQAVAEVQNAIAQEEQQSAHIEHLEEQLEAANDTLESARDRYRQGLADFLNVLTALQTQQQAELNLLTARRQLLSYRIQLHRALGGTWTRELQRPPELETP